MKKWTLFIPLFISAIVASAQQTIPPFSTPYGNFTTGIKLNGSYGTVGQTPCSTGTGVTWGNCGGGGGGLPAATTLGQIPVSTGAGFSYVAQSKPYIDAKDYGCVFDGSTSNNSCLSGMQADAAAVVVGIPYVHLGCDGGVNCALNFGGSGTSPIHITVPQTFDCAGATLNYTGTAHVMDLDYYAVVPLVIEGCRFTGAASATHGIYAGTFAPVNVTIRNNTFYDFGNTTGYDIYFAGQPFEVDLLFNQWWDDDGGTRNAAYFKGSFSSKIIGNTQECQSNPAGPCSTAGRGIYVGEGTSVLANVLQYHYPELTLGQGKGTVIANHFEGNSGQPLPAISYGDQQTGVSGITCSTISGNTFYSNLASGVPLIGPETAVSGTNILSRCDFSNNEVGPPTVASPYIVTNFGTGNIWGKNLNGGGLITPASTPAPFDYPGRNFTIVANTYPLPNGLTALGPDEQNIGPANLHDFSVTLQCQNSVPSGAAQTCNSTTQQNPINAYDCVLFSTNTANTGAMTLNVNGYGAWSVKKQSGGSLVDPAANDILASNPYLLCANAANQWVMK